MKPARLQEVPVTERELVVRYFEMGFRLTFWPQIGDDKGPRREGWPQECQTIDDYREGHRVGALTGVEIEPGTFLHDVDVDWTPGSMIAQAMLPPTSFVYGRPSKKISHCFYTLSAGHPLVSYKDPVDSTMLIELRGTKQDGTVGLQSMLPPSIWSKDDRREPLDFVRFGRPSHLESSLLTTRVGHAAIGMLLAKYLGHNGFGHDARLCWAGFLLRAGVEAEDLVRMGEAMSVYCNNREVSDVRRVVESTLLALQQREGKKVKGGPALIKLLGTHGWKIVNQINEWLGRHQDFVKDKNGDVLAKNQHNIRRAIALLGHDLSYDAFSGKKLIDGRYLDDSAWQRLYLKIDREYRFQPPTDYFRIVINDAAEENSFHPVKQYLDALAWDKTPRLDAWVITAAHAKDNKYVRAVSSIALIAAVRRIREPGCKYDEMLVLESEQGLNKSSALRALCPNEAWFSDDLRLNLQSKELIEATIGKWLIEASDLAGKRKTEIEQLKALLSRRVDGPARMAYAYEPVERARHFIIIGTTNSAAYLNDPTGARRFWPIKVQRFNVESLVKDRDQLWAEACAREAERESIRLDEKLWPIAEEEQEKRREIDPWEPILGDALLNVAPGSDEMRRLATDALWNALGVFSERRDRAGALRISDVMQRFGFRRTKVRVDKEKPPVQGYISVEAKDPKLTMWAEEGKADEEAPGKADAASGKVPDDEIPF